MAHVTSVHYAISNPFIYTIIFNFSPDARGFVFLFSSFALGVFLNFGARLFFRHFVVGGH